MKMLLYVCVCIYINILYISYFRMLMIISMNVTYFITISL